MAGALTTHVLDTSIGKPAAQVKIDLWKLDSEKRFILGTFETNQNGRIDYPLLEGEDLTEGVYELVFYVGTYFGKDTFLDKVPIQFSVTNKEEHYHIPLLIAPGGYSTYRGS
ncbi:5-hydroxyisourate hydrolase [Alkalihalobacillus alcalophilus ATCC 27647 = CGMCC 1.3604]|uniref:5-hydroxyisourate hydrolase n=1 Tax=Alkalihalobacillus alcalophilus ATCC 27647 = CGMCC 1.3604 TaxID=1218173 RepID=A0A094WM57_ALKAL|nr:hydroxyisourate hydrolase [Alkalihalobacillus alcalophilus]KGA98819.1 5-hydroxyisourate hydrolase [Alkalihalobacillus alcalophilus ATCC 27647 = CGMCC 1.3604]MED1561002.1 hydroxyisourate hydrolase [Alkalihalobacillus alcalophilus]THG91552.1 5-hydroxyisourate hydrolase [Alkalihalobacillus alcalophilus ATCC 27647 = CGMCC 1.3604]